MRLHYSIVDEVIRTALIDLRKKRGLTQRQLAYRAGRAQSWIGKIESGDRYFRLFDLVECSLVFDVPVPQLARRLLKRAPRNILSGHRPNSTKSRRPNKAGERAWLTLLAAYSAGPAFNRRNRKRR